MGVKYRRITQPRVIIITVNVQSPRQVGDYANGSQLLAMIIAPRRVVYLNLAVAVAVQVAGTPPLAYF